MDADGRLAELLARLEVAEAQRDEALKVVVAAKRYVDDLSTGAYRRSATTMLSNLAILRKALGSFDAVALGETQGDREGTGPKTSRTAGHPG